MGYLDELRQNRIELSEMICDIRQQKGISQKELYEGICTKKAYQDLENGEGIGDEWMAECLLSRLHVQYRLLEIFLSERDFERKESRYRIGILLQKGQTEKAKEALAEYEAKAKKSVLDRQYILWKKAELLKETEAQAAGQMAKEALELTLPVSEAEERLRGKVILSEMELELYLLYRKCVQRCSLAEYKEILEKLQQAFLSEQICLRCYFETMFEFVVELFRMENYEECRKWCTQTIEELRRGNRFDFISEFFFISAIAGLHRMQSEEEKKGLRQEIKTAYYTAMSFGREEIARRMRTYCEEVYGWRITT